jgi:hypothetical protein
MRTAAAGQDAQATPPAWPIATATQRAAEQAAEEVDETVHLNRRALRAGPSPALAHDGGAARQTFPVIASEAKQSMLAQAERWIASSLRSSHDDEDMTPHFPRHVLPEFLSIIVPPKIEGAGKAGCRPHPQPRVRMKQAHE